MAVLVGIRYNWLKNFVSKRKEKTTKLNASFSDIAPEGIGR